tara:strand:- start:2697 stop:3437 length:741 start_codon:yes stop_codon:yes gene_type:complete
MLESWQSFQSEFARYLRDPENERLPEGVIPRRAKVYEDLLFKNICGFLNSCFPVCKTLLGESEWASVARNFFRDWRCHSPRFNDIPKEFIDYLSADSSPELRYPWLLQLAHYEWVELAVDTFDESSVEVNNSAEKGSIYVNPTLHNLIYDWPVHQISPDYLPTEQKPTFLLVYRNSENKVAFTEINAATSALINLFEQAYTKSEEVLSELASQMNVPFNDAFNAFGLEMINQLIVQGMLIDVQASS